MDYIVKNQLDNTSERIIQSYFMIGLNISNIKKFNEEENDLEFLQNIDFYKSKDVIKNPIFRPNTNEKWQAINSTSWLRLKYNKVYDMPITGLKIIDCEFLNSEYLVSYNYF